MDNSGYDQDRDSAENSMERRLRIENAATGIALMSSKLSGRNGGGKNSSGSQPQSNEGGRAKGERRNPD